jgi:hypothetical protein
MCFDSTYLCIADNGLENPTAVMTAPASPQIILIPMDYFSPLNILLRLQALFLLDFLLAVGVQFTQASVFAKSHVTFLVKITSFFPFNLRFKKLLLEFSDSSHNKQVLDHRSIDNTDNELPSTQPATSTENILSATEGDLLLVVAQPKLFTFQFLSKEKMELKVGR